MNLAKPYILVEHDKIKQSHLRHKDQSKDHTGTYNETGTVYGGICVHILPQAVCGHHGNSHDDTAHVDGGSNVFGIVESLHLHLSGLEGKKEGKDLQQGLETKEYAQPYLPGLRIAGVDGVHGRHFKYLWRACTQLMEGCLN